MSDHGSVEPEPEEERSDLTLGPTPELDELRERLPDEYAHLAQPRPGTPTPFSSSGPSNQGVGSLANGNPSRSSHQVPPVWTVLRHPEPVRPAP